MAHLCIEYNTFDSTHFLFYTCIRHPFSFALYDFVFIVYSRIQHNKCQHFTKHWNEVNECEMVFRLESL